MAEVPDKEPFLEDNGLDLPHPALIQQIRNMFDDDTYQREWDKLRVFDPKRAAQFILIAKEAIPNDLALQEKVIRAQVLANFATKQQAEVIYLEKALALDSHPTPEAA